MLKLTKVSYWFWVLAALLVTFGTLALGPIGLVLAFWVLLLWYSAWQRPYRFELMLISGLGLLGAIFMLPTESWADRYRWAFAFLIVAALPVIDWFIPWLRIRS